MTEAIDRGALRALLERPPLRRLLTALNGGGEETRIVGGAVRNALIGVPVHEIDLATTALPDTVAARSRRAGFKVVPTGLRHGTLTVIVEGEPFEITTLREDVETHGRHATVRFGRDFAADARRRDFTINALSVDADGVVHDPIGGLADLARRRVRFIGDPAARIREDYLRILRFFRFHAEYGHGALDGAGLHAAITGRAGLAVLSRERIRMEMLKLLAARRAAEVVGIISETGFLDDLLGGVGDLGRLARAVRRDAQRGRGPDPVLRLAALAVLTTEDADRLRDRLRLSNAEHASLRAFAMALARLKALPMPIDARAVRRLVAEHGIVVADVLAVIVNEPRPVLEADAPDALHRFVTGAEAAPVFRLRGADLLAAGVPPGPKVGTLLAKAREEWLAAGCPTDRAAMARLLEGVLAVAGR